MTPPSPRASRAAVFFTNHKMGAIPVTDDQNRIIGIVSYLNILRALLVGRVPTN